MKKTIIEKVSIDFLLANPAFAHKLDSSELAKLEKQFPGFTCLSVSYEIGDSFFQYLKSKKERRGEVVFVLQNEHKKTLLHTKPQFPDGLYRLLTGGIDQDEPVLSALEREVYEETGFHFNDCIFNGLIAILMTNNDQQYPFVSYTFTMPGISGEPRIIDESENISGFKWATRKDLVNVYHQLLGLDDWYDWGVLRALPHLLLEPDLLVIESDEPQ